MTLPAVVFLHPNDGCLTAARALVRRGVQVRMLATPEYAYVLASRGVSGRAMPDIRTDSDQWFDELNALDDAVVLSGSDASTEWLTRVRPMLHERLRTFESSDRVHIDLMDKRQLYRIAAEAGVRAPWTLHAATRTELDDVVADVAFPCVVKPTLGHVAKLVVGVGTVLA